MARPSLTIISEEVKSDNLEVIDLPLLVGRILREKGAPTTKQQQNNKLQFGVKYPCAITEALISIKTATGGKSGRIDNTILKSTPALLYHYHTRII